jgi:hypothetical protein
MDEDDFDEKRREASVDAAGGKHLAHPVLAEEVPVSALRRGGTSDARTSVVTPADHAARPGIVWVRASDLLSTGTGRIAGRGIDFEAELTRRMRRTPATTRRAIRERADRLPPLSEFGPSREYPPFSRYGLGRR